MKILYVTTLFAGFEDLLKGDTEAKGLPSFIFPLQRLLEGGHQVDIILVSNFKGPLNIQVSWLKRENIIANINNDLTGSGFSSKVAHKAKSVRQLYRAIVKAHKRVGYDFIYGHGKAGAMANFAANRLGVPCGCRLYGTFDLYQRLENSSRLGFLLRNPVYSAIFKQRKKFLLITDDGSRGQEVYDRLKPRKHPYPCYVWLNGVDIEPIETLEDACETPEHPYLFCPGRIDPCKRQDRVIEALRLCHEQGMGELHLYLAGHITEDYQDYYDRLKKQTRDAGLTEYVHFLGAVSRRALKKYAYYARATVLMYDYFARGSVFYEAFSTGAVVIGLTTGQLEGFIEHGRNGFIVADEAGVADVVVGIGAEPDTVKLKNSAIQTANKLLITWAKRIDKEQRLIELSACALYPKKTAKTPLGEVDG